jgi:hypothetical protein
MTLPNNGDRVRVTGILPDDPAPLAIGEEGTVDGVFNADDPRFAQISVKWDSGRTLFLLPNDPFKVIR